MNTGQLILKCYAEQEEGAWVAVCLDFNLAAQAETQRAAREKLEAMILSYVTEALTTDRQYADQLLSRRAPFTSWLKYYYLLAVSYIRKNHPLTFREVMPLRPA